METSWATQAISNLEAFKLRPSDGPRELDLLMGSEIPFPTTVWDGAMKPGPEIMGFQLRPTSTGYIAGFHPSTVLETFLGIESSSTWLSPQEGGLNQPPQNDHDLYQLPSKWPRKQFVSLGNPVVFCMIQYDTAIHQVVYTTLLGQIEETSELDTWKD